MRKHAAAHTPEMGVQRSARDEPQCGRALLLVSGGGLLNRQCHRNQTLDHLSLTWDSHGILEIMQTLASCLADGNVDKSVVEFCGLCR